MAAYMPASRRRPVIATDKKTSTNIKLIAIDAAVSPAAATSGTGNGKTVTSAGNARDLSHLSIHGETVLKRKKKNTRKRKNNKEKKKNKTRERRGRRKHYESLEFDGNQYKLDMI